MNNSSYTILKWFWIAEDLRIRAILTNQSKNWYLQFQQPGHGKGRQRRKSLGTTSEKEARIRGQRFARAFEGGQIPTTSLQAATVEKVVALKLDRLQADGAAASTSRLYTWYFAMLCEILPRKGNTSITMLTPLMLTDFAMRLRTQGISLPSAKNPEKRKARTLSPRTVREVLKAVRGLIRLAKSLKLIAIDPTDGYMLPKGSSPEVEIFTASELHLLFGDPIMGDVWHFLAHTGLRLEEFCWLSKADIIHDGQSKPVALHIRHKLCPQTGEGWWPKHKVERIVPLTPMASEILAKALAASFGHWAFAAPVTAHGFAGKWPHARLRATLARQLRAYHINHGTPHVFRHTCASFLANTARMPVTLLQRFLGHRSLESTMRYLHTRSEDVAQALTAGDFSKLALPPADAKSQAPEAPASPAPPDNSTSSKSEASKEMAVGGNTKPDNHEERK